MNKLSSRDRLLTAFLLEEPDMVPVSVRIGGISIPWMSEAGILEYVMRNSDVIWRTGVPGANIFFTRSVKIHVENRVEEGIHIYRVETPKGTLTSIARDTIKGKPYVGSWTLKHFLETEKDVEKFLSIPYSPCIPDFESLLKKKRSLGDRGVMVIGISDPVGIIGELFPTQKFIRYCLNEDSLIKELLSLMFERIYDYLERILEVDEDSVIEISGPELVAPPFLHPKFFDKLVVEYDKKLVKLIHQHSHLAFMHCHGKVNRLLERIADIGVDGLHPLEPPPSGDVDLADAKKRIGDRVCLIGNIRLDDLVRCSRKELEEKCRDAIRQAAPGGGYVLEPTATPLPDTPTRNIISFIKAGRKYGSYSFI
ncbi:MAG: hypothetical protein AYL29_014230 [Candidatus Bathyarchaeota archaeon B24]|nr:MAG: hypothetical protein AYL29_014230 [Candidatus Bathyarchaeota archaeon B24]